MKRKDSIALGLPFLSTFLDYDVILFTGALAKDFDTIFVLQLVQVFY